MNELLIDFCDNSSISANNTDVRKKYSFTFDVQNWSQDLYNFIDFNVKYNHYYFDNIKIEKGTKATDWSPAPEDILSLIHI